MSVDAKRFVKEHWPWMAVAGAATLVGGVIVLTIRYMREKNKGMEEAQLKILEQEAVAGKSPTHVRLTTGTDLLTQVDGAAEAAVELMGVLPDELAEELQTTLDAAGMEKSARNR